MSDNNHIPEHDPDLQLARSYGQFVSGEQDASGIEDPLFEVLSGARDADEEANAAIPVRGQEHGWQRIRQHISKEETEKEVKIFSLHGRKKWYWAAAAVALIILSSIPVLLQTFETEPQLIAESGSSLTSVELTDDSRVTLRPNSRLHEIRITESEHTYSLSGEALFEVAEEPERTFSVEAGPGRVVVSGTRFNLHDRHHQSSVYLLDGEVVFETLDRDQQVRLSPGESVAIDRQNLLHEPVAFETEEAIDWTNNRLTFSNREVGSVLEELEFHFDITIRAPDELKQETLGGSIPLDSAEKSLEDLGAVLGGGFVRTDASTYEFRIDP